jgi:hypothetical protein
MLFGEEAAAQAHVMVDVAAIMSLTGGILHVIITLFVRKQS